jgi:site-specific DNA-methyltransferase (adenine-specific)
MSAPRNRTITLSDAEEARCRSRLKRLSGPVSLAEILDSTICQDIFEILDWLPEQSIDLVFADPPYNLTRSFGQETFKSRTLEAYEGWLETWIPRLARVLKPAGSIYICGDWRSSAAIHRVAERYFVVRNRITWEREKGRGAKNNWKNASEDIWFCTVSDDYIFNVDAVKLKRRVMAPYTDGNGQPKDWDDTQAGRFRLTHPSNLWVDLTVPFWSMPENTDHPTQKPEKLLAKVILASTREGAVVLDPFLGSGTTSVVAKKLDRHYIGVEIDERYCCLAEKRLEMAHTDRSIQGYTAGVFWERNTLPLQKQAESEPEQETDLAQPRLL